MIAYAGSCLLGLGLMFGPAAAWATTDHLRARRRTS